MALAHDKITESATFTTTTPFTFVHTPVGAPKAVILFIYHGTVSTDLITGAVTYGGVAMTRIQRATDTATEPGGCYVYFLGAGIPTGAQTVSIGHTGSADVKQAVCYTATAGADTAVVASNVINENAPNPQIALNSPDAALRYFAIYSGTAGPMATTCPVIAGMTQATGTDFGAFCGGAARETSPSTGNTTVGFTAATDDVAMVAIAVRERLTLTGAAALVGDGILAGLAKVDWIAKAALVGDGTLAAAGVRTYAAIAALSGDATLAAAAVRLLGAAGVLTGDGVVVAAPTVVGIKLGQAALLGSATLAALGSETYAGKSALDGGSLLGAVGALTAGGAAVLAGDALLNALAALTMQAQAALLADGVVAAAGTITAGGGLVEGACALSGSADLAAAASLDLYDKPRFAIVSHGDHW